eukprot:22525-Pleurochrysis_carterae.AAC.2
MPVAVAGLETRSADYSRFGTAQGAGHIMGRRNNAPGQRKAAGGREQRKVPAGEGGQRIKGARREEGQRKAPGIQPKSCVYSQNTIVCWSDDPARNVVVNYEIPWYPRSSGFRNSASTLRMSADRESFDLETPTECADM